MRIRAAVLAAFSLANTGGLCCVRDHEDFDFQRVLDGDEIDWVLDPGRQTDTRTDCEVVCELAFDAGQVERLDSCELELDPAYVAGAVDTAVEARPGGTVTCSGRAVLGSPCR